MVKKPLFPPQILKIQDCMPLTGCVHGGSLTHPRPSRYVLSTQMPYWGYSTGSCLILLIYATVSATGAPTFSLCLEGMAGTSPFPITPNRKGQAYITPKHPSQGHYLHFSLFFELLSKHSEKMFITSPFEPNLMQYLKNTMASVIFHRLTGVVGLLKKSYEKNFWRVITFPQLITMLTK